MELIDGKKIAAEIKEELRKDIEKRKKDGKMVPGLAAILVGDDPASHIYVKNKKRDCDKIGMKSVVEEKSADISEEELVELVESYNHNPEYHGILVQLPLPDHIDDKRIINTIRPEKDADGFHPISMGNLVIGNEGLRPCTPAGIMEMLKYYNIETSGKHVVVVGRSNIVGKPIANLMLQKNKAANSIVTICHSAAEDISVYTKQADILIAAVGRAEMIKADMVKDGVVAIDVGMNRVDDASKKKGYRLCGDVDFEGVSEKASYITPVPGGVGPMTIAMLLKNTYKACLLTGN